MTPVFRPTNSIQSWGRVIRSEHQAARPAFRDELGGLMDQLSPAAPGLAIGLRRSYGDSGLNPGGRVIDMTGLDRLIAFDRSTGVMRGEAGVSLSQCLRALVPAGWFLPTTPGASFVTLGGAVANDVHGKNHFSAGSFGNAVRRLGLRRTDGAVHDLQPGDPLFTATIGGLGLTGVIEWVEFQAVRIPSSWLDAEDVAFRNLDEFFDLSDERKDTAEHAMAWVDGLAIGASLGRGVYSFANWSSANRSRQEKSAPERERPRKKMPMDAPGFLLNSFSVKAFNEIYNGLKTMQAGKRLTHHEPFLYPLDAISDWNRLYGARGFYQYQSVVPTVTAREAVRDQLKLIARSRQGSFLAVLKNMGPILSVGTLSFPMSGTTLAMDFPNRGKRTLQLMSDLDRIVMEAGGRLYPAKDGRMSASMFQAGFPQWKDFRAQVDPGLSSGFWRRVSA